MWDWEPISSQLKRCNGLVWIKSSWESHVFLTTTSPRRVLHLLRCGSFLIFRLFSGTYSGWWSRGKSERMNYFQACRCFPQRLGGRESLRLLPRKNLMSKISQKVLLRYAIFASNAALPGDGNRRLPNAPIILLTFYHPFVTVFRT